MACTVLLVLKSGELIANQIWEFCYLTEKLEKPVYLTSSFDQIFSVNRRNFSDSGPGLVVHCLWQLNLTTVFDTVHAAGPGHSQRGPEWRYPLRVSF